MFSTIQQLHIYVNVTVFRNMTPTRLIDTAVGGIFASVFKVVRCFQSADVPCRNLLTDFHCMRLQVLTTVTIIIVTFWANLNSPSSGYTLLQIFNTITTSH